MVCLLIQHADNETNEIAWPRLPPASGRAPPATAVSIAGNVGHGSTTAEEREREMESREGTAGKG